MKFRKDIESFIDRLQDRVPDSTDDLLESLGLQRKRSLATVILPSVGTLVVGAAIGAALGMLFGPRYGYRLMDRIGVKIPENLKQGTQQSTMSSGMGAVGSNNATMRTRSDVHS